MPGVQLPIGIDTVNPVPADYKYGPYANTAAAIAAIPQVLRYDGLTVQITGTGEYHWLAADLTDPGLIPKTGGASGAELPIAQYVYLENDASDQTRMGGTGSNVYITAQAAFDAAVILSAGNTVPVCIKVGKTVSATVGGITLVADWPSMISIVGIGSNDSQIGAITLNNALGNAYNISSLNLSNIAVGNISARPTGVSGDGGDITLYLDNAKVGNISNYPSSSNSAGSSGNISISSISYSTSKVGVIENGVRSNSSTGVLGSLSIIGVGRIAVDYIGNGFSDKVGVSGGNIILYNVDIAAELFGISIWRLSYDGCIIRNTTTVGSVVFNQALVILTANSEFIFNSLKVEGVGGIAVLSIYGFTYSPYVYLADCITEGLLFWDAEYLEIYNVKSENIGSFALNIVNCTTVRIVSCLFAEYSNTANVFDIDDAAYGILDLKILNSSLLFGIDSISAVSATTIESGGTYFESPTGPNISINPLPLDI